jgi:RNA polymerase sigma factor (sigma-70 family)
MKAMMTATLPSPAALTISKERLFEPDGLADQIVRRRAKRLVGHRGFRWDDLDDLQQELRLALLQRWDRFDGRNPGGFIYHVVRNRAVELLRMGRKGFYDGLPNERSLDDEIDGPEGGRIPLVELLRLEDDLRRAFPGISDEERTDLRVDLQTVIDHLPEPQRQMCEALKTQSITEYSRSIGKPTGTVQKRVVKIREDFENAGLRAYHPSVSA